VYITELKAIMTELQGEPKKADERCKNGVVENEVRN
jgi:hypothetical protein